MYRVMYIAPDGEPMWHSSHTQSEEAFRVAEMIGPHCYFTSMVVTPEGWGIDQFGEWRYIIH